MQTYTCGTTVITPYSLNKLFPFVETFERRVMESLSVTIVTDKEEITLLHQQVERFADSTKDKVTNGVSVDEWVYRIASDLGSRGRSTMNILGFVFNYTNDEEDMEEELVIPGRFFRY